MENPPSSWSPPFWPWDPAALTPGSHVHGTWWLARSWPLLQPLSSCSLLCSYSLCWTANQRPGNTQVRSPCGASQMQVVLYSIAHKDNLHHPSVFPLTFSAVLTSLYNQQQWLPLMTRTTLVKAAAGAPPWLTPEPTEDTPVYVISSKHGLVAHVRHWNWQLETVWGLTSEYRTLYLLGCRMCAC